MIITVIKANVTPSLEAQKAWLLKVSEVAKELDTLLKNPPKISLETVSQTSPTGSIIVRTTPTKESVTARKEWFAKLVAVENAFMAHNMQIPVIEISLFEGVEE